MRLVALLLYATLMAGSQPVAAQAWPSKPVRIILAVSNGTAPDLIVRLVSERLSRNFGRQFIVDNMPGARGLIASQAAARSAPDGYTFYLAGVGVYATDRRLFKTLPYDADRDFVPVAMIYERGAMAIAVHPDVPARNLGELIALAKSQPGKLSYATDATGYIPIVGQWFNKVAGTDIVAVPYKSVGAMLLDTAAGRTQMLIAAIAAMESYRTAGKLRVLAVTSPKRFPALADVPTVAETLPGFRAGGFGILVAPAGTPPHILRAMNAAVDPLVRDPEFAQRLLSFGYTAGDAGTPQSLAEFIRAEGELWDTIVKALGIQPE